MTDCQRDILDQAVMTVLEARAKVSDLVDSREKSLAITKLDEARLWLRELDTNLRVAEMTNL